MKPHRREKMKRIRFTKRIAVLGLTAGALALYAQQQPVKTPSVAAPTPFLSLTSVPSNVREYLIVLGDRIQKPGKERLTLTGMSTDPQHAAVPATLVWEVPGRLRFDRAAAGASSLVFDDVSGLSKATVLSDSDLGILESLLNDSAEAFLYSFSQGHAHRFLGGRFRTDAGKNPNYSGPWYDIYQSIAPAQAPTVVLPPTQKLFQFDSITKLFVRATYIQTKNGKQIPTSTEYTGWTVTGGQATPGKIVRNEGGLAVFMFDVKTATVGPKANDGSFPGH
jgi:hypothetical protein